MVDLQGQYAGIKDRVSASMQEVIESAVSLMAQGSLISRALNLSRASTLSPVQWH